MDQQVLHQICPNFQIERVKKIGSSNEAIDYLLSLEKMDRNAQKYVLLDCATHVAKVKKGFF